MLLVLWACGYAQTACEQSLNFATEEFNAGHFYGIPAELKPCIDNGFTKEQRQRAYLLLTQTYLLLDDPIGAETSYLQLLQANPEFVAVPDREPIDVVYLSKKFTATPIFSIYGKIGSNASFAHVINDWSITGSGNENQKYVLKPGWQVSMGVDWNLNDKFAVALEAGYMFSAYKKVVENIFSNDITQIYDRQNFINVPLSFKYNLHIPFKWKPYVYAGGAAGFQIGAKAFFTITDRDPSGEGTFVSETTESPSLKFGSRRQKFNRSLFFGGGVRYKLGLNFLFADFRYAVGLSNLANQARYFDYGDAAIGSDVFQSGIPIFSYGHVDDDFRLDHLSITVGYIKPLYKPRKLKNARTKSVQRTIRKYKEDEQRD